MACRKNRTCANSWTRQLKIKQPKSELEELLALQLKAAKIKFVREVSVIKGRKWRWDFRIQGDVFDEVYNGAHLVEVQGGTWHKGAHSSGAGLHRDYQKNNAAALAGFKTFYFDRQMIEDGTALKTIERALGRA